MTAGKIIAWTLVPVGLGALLIGSAQGLKYLNQQRGHLQGTNAGFEGIDILDIDLPNKTMKVRAFVRIHNKSDLDIKVLRQKFDIYLNKTLVQKVEKNAPVLLRARGETTTSVDVTVKLDEVYRNVITSLSSMLDTGSFQDTAFRIDGILSLQAGIVTINSFKFDITKNLKDMINGFRNR